MSTEPLTPTTDAGRRVLAALERVDATNPKAAEAPIGWWQAVIAIELEARQQGLDAARLPHDRGADAEPEDDDQWSVGYDEGFAAAKRLCAALEQAATAERSVPAPTLPALDAESVTDEQMVALGWTAGARMPDGRVTLWFRDAVRDAV